MSQDQITTPVITVEPTKTETTKTASSHVSQESRNLALLSHLSGILFSFIVPLVIYLIKTEDVFVREESKEALNFQIALAIIMLCCTLLGFLILPLLLIPVLWTVNIVFCILAAISTSSGIAYKYPVSIRLIK